MRKGFKLTLMTVALVMVSVQAWAMAPVIKEIPGVVVGSAEAITGASKFVFPDALDLSNMATDDTTTPSLLMWTYTGSSLHYTINGIAPLSGSAMTVSAITSPTTANIINRTVLGGELNLDSKANTVTVRNQTLSPLGGANATVTGSGIIPAETQAVTFFCSDGTSYSSKSVFFYTNNGGSDKLSGGWEPIQPPTVPPRWQANYVDNAGHTDFMGGVSTSSANLINYGGVCLYTPAAGINLGSVNSPMGFIQIARNKLYRIKLKMNGSQADTLKGTVPVWDFVIENYDPVSFRGKNMYIQDTQIFENMNGTTTGGANGIWNKTTDQYVTIYWAPPAVGTAQWNTVAYSSAIGNDVNPRARFRILDVDGAQYGNGQNRLGTLCIQSITIDAIDVSRAVGTSVYNNTNLIAATTTPGVGNVEVTSPLVNSTGGLTNVTPTFAGGALTLAPKDSTAAMGGNNIYDGRLTDLTEVRPATDLTYAAGPPWTSAADNWPIPWTAGTVYRMTVGLSAPDATSQAHPYDAFVFAMSSPTDEIDVDAYQTTAMGAGSPQQGTPQDYVFFYDGGNGTNAPDANYAKLKWRFKTANVPGAYFPSMNPTTDPNNIGSVKISYVKVDTVTFQ